MKVSINMVDPGKYAASTQAVNDENNKKNRPMLSFGLGSKPVLNFTENGIKLELYGMLSENKNADQLNK